MPDILVVGFKLILAIFFAWCIGWERESSGKPAGTRTYGLVALGSTLFTIIALEGFNQFTGNDPSRIIGQIIVGIGFIGAGLIIFDKHHVEGLTTAAALWATAAVGVTIGLGWYAISFLTVALIFILLSVIGHLEYKYRHPGILKKLKKKSKNHVSLFKN